MMLSSFHVVFSNLNIIFWMSWTNFEMMITLTTKMLSRAMSLKTMLFLTISFLTILAMLFLTMSFLTMSFLAMLLIVFWLIFWLNHWLVNISVIEKLLRLRKTFSFKSSLLSLTKVRALFLMNLNMIIVDLKTFLNATVFVAFANDFFYLKFLNRNCESFFLNRIWLAKVFDNFFVVFCIIDRNNFCVIMSLLTSLCSFDFWKTTVDRFLYNVISNVVISIFFIELMSNNFENEIVFFIWALWLWKVLNDENWILTIWKW